MTGKEKPKEEKEPKPKAKGKGKGKKFPKGAADRLAQPPQIMM